MYFIGVTLRRTTIFFPLWAPRTDWKGSTMSKKLSERAVAGLRRHGRHCVSDNLYLRVGKGRRAWEFRYQLGGKKHHLGLGAADLRSLASARQEAHKLRQQLHLEGVDPLQHRRVAHAQAALDAARSVTFAECTERFLKGHESSWSVRHRQAWRNTLTQYVFPQLGEVPISAIGKDEVLRVLEPIWHDLPVTAARVRNRIAQVLDWAIARDLRSSDNPAALRKLLPQINRQVRHLSAMPYAQLPAFMAALHQQQDVAARALELAILTAARLSEVLGMCWSEVDLTEAVWTVPAERMKGKREHRIALSKPALRLLQALSRDADLIFHHPQHPDHLLHHSEPLQVMRRMGRRETVHGMRSAFRDWASERTAFPYEVCERALAHVTGSAASRAYARSDRLEERRKLMQAWAMYLDTPAAKAERGEIVPLRA
jgi:integrase